MEFQSKVLLIIIVFTGAAATENTVIVSTVNGKISGFKEQSTKGNEFHSFHSIPYAKPPIGNLRLKDPVPSESWSGVRNGSIVPSICSQIPFIAVTKRKPVYDGSEDCLYLSVFTSKPGDRDANLPVMVFIHGGAFFASGINKYTPYVLMNEAIVFVIIQYRLGILGFLSTEDTVIPGNFGLKDQVLALKWIQENIQNFGGNKNKVTIFGESAGGASVHFHLISPYSEGLFSGGILQSGTLFSPWAIGGAFKEVALYTGNLFNCPNVDFASKKKSEALLSCLQNIDVVNLTLSLMDHIHWNFNPVLLGPRVDEDYIPDEPEILMKEGRHKKLNIISGVTSHEGGLFVFPLFANEALKSDLLNNFEEMGPASLDIRRGDISPVDLAKSIFNYFVGGVKASKEDADNLCKLYSDWQFAVGHDLVAKLYSENTPENQVYLYELNHRGQRSLGDYYDVDIGKDWVDHVDDLFYLFTGEENVLWKPLEREEDLKLRDIITKLWYNFASTGNPTSDDSLGFTWSPISQNDFSHLSLKPEPSMEKDHRKEVRKFLQILPTKQNYLLNPSSVVLIQQRCSQESDVGEKIVTSPSKYGPRDEL